MKFGTGVRGDDASCCEPSACESTVFELVAIGAVAVV